MATAHQTVLGPGRMSFAQAIAAQVPSGPPVPLRFQDTSIDLASIDDLGPSSTPRNHGSRRTQRPRSQSATPLRKREKAFVGAARLILANYEDDRPKTRGDCLKGGVNEQRPCPWTSCRWHLYLGVNETTGGLKYQWPGVALEDLPATCALDVADEHERTGRHEQPMDFVSLGRLLNMDDTGARRQLHRYERTLREALEDGGVDGVGSSSGGDR